MNGNRAATRAGTLRTLIEPAHILPPNDEPSMPDETNRNAMVVHPQYGAYLPGRWVPAPRYLLRRDRLLAHLSPLRPGRVIEVGCGSGAFLHELQLRGFRCTGLDTSAAAIATSRLLLGGAIELYDRAQPNWEGQFDYLVACEVLEHIEDDKTALQSWLKWLKGGGTVFLSVPAHMSLWGPHDVFSGHVRRYSRDALDSLARECGVVDRRIECYGFPITTITHKLRNLAVRHQARGSQVENTAKSGIDRSVDTKLFGYQTSLPGRLIMKTGCLLQRLFLRTELGEGYLLVGRILPSHSRSTVTEAFE